MIPIYYCLYCKNKPINNCYLEKNFQIGNRKKKD